MPQSITGNGALLKIALGTARFGMDYGIGKDGKQVRQGEVFCILSKAAEAGVEVIDTAHGYGESEKIIGSYLRTNKNSFKVISKLPKCSRDDVAKLFKESLRDLGVEAIYGYLVHSFTSYKADNGIWDELCRLKSEGKVKKIGFSLYYPSELEELLNKNLKFDIVQIPCSVLDQRFFPYLKILTERGVEIHARSIFLQGLLLQAPAELNGRFKEIFVKLTALREMSRSSGVPLELLCLLFVALNGNIDKAVIGMGSVRHLESNIEAFKYGSKAGSIYEDLLSLREDDEDIIVPARWAMEAGKSNS